MEEINVGKGYKIKYEVIHSSTNSSILWGEYDSNGNQTGIAGNLSWTKGTVENIIADYRRIKMRKGLLQDRIIDLKK